MIATLTRRLRGSLSFRLMRYAQRLRTAEVESRLEEAGVGGSATIPTHTNSNELRTLFDLAVALPLGSAAVEIGSYLGASTCFLAAGIASVGGTLVCVDTWANETMPEGTRDTFEEFCRNTAGVAGVLRLLRKNSMELSNGDLPQGVSLAFVDGDHSYPAVRHDLDILGPIVVPGGIVAFHDARAFSGVHRTIAEALMTGGWDIEGRVDNLVWLRKRRAQPQ